MGAKFSDLTTPQLTAALRELGPAYEAIEQEIERTRLDGLTIQMLAGDQPVDSIEGVTKVLEEANLSETTSGLVKMRLVAEIKRNESVDRPTDDDDNRNEPLQRQVNEALDRARQRTAVATATAAAVVGESVTATAPASANEVLQQLHRMPPALRSFEPLSLCVYIAALASCQKLVEAENNIVQNALDVEAASHIRLVSKQIQGLMKIEVTRRLVQPGIGYQLQRVVNAGREDFMGVYRSVWNRIKINEKTDVARYEKAVKGITPAAQTGQTATDIVQLLQHASQCKPLFEQQIKDIINECYGGEDPLAPKTRIPDNLKHVVRIVEKLQLNPEGPSDSVSNIFDVVRGMIRCRSMADVAKVVETIAGLESITIVRVKDRFVAHPTSGGWRDCQICFFANDDQNKHVCEIQVVHDDLYASRAQLPGHIVYERMRNAEEILAVLSNGCRGWFDHDLNGPEHAWFRCCISGTSTVAVQASSLMTLFSTARGKEWKDSKGWCCAGIALKDWHGVTLDDSNNVTTLRLADNKLRGNVVCTVHQCICFTFHSLLWWHT